MYSGMVRFGGSRADADGIIAACFLGLFSILLGLAFASLYVGAAAAICGCVFGMLAARATCSSKLTLVSCASFAAGIVVAAIIYQSYIVDYGVPYWVPGSDDLMLENDARQCIAKGYVSVFDMVNGDTVRERLHNTKGYVIFLTYLMMIGEPLGGYHTMVPRIVNIFLLNAIALLVVRLFLMRFAEKESKACVLYALVALFPNSLYIASHVYRDVIAAFFLVAVFYLCVRRRKGARFVVSAVVVAVILFLAYWVRESLLVFALGIILLSFLMEKRSSQLRKVESESEGASDGTGRGRSKLGGAANIKVRTVVVAFVCIAVGAVALVQFGDTILYYLTRYTERLSGGGDGIVAAIYSLPLLPFGIPARFIAYFISPFYFALVFDPTQWLASTQSFCSVLISIGTVYLVSQYVYLVRGFKVDGRTVLVVALLVLGIALTTFGYRHVVMVYPFMFLAIAEGKAAMSGQDAVALPKISLVVGLLFVCAFAALYIL